MRTLRTWGVKWLARYGSLTKRWGREGQKIQAAQESNKLFHASMSLPNGFPVWISLLHLLGDSAKMSGPLQNFPSFFKAEWTISILRMHLYLLYYEHFLYYGAEMSNCPTYFLIPSIKNIETELIESSWPAKLDFQLLPRLPAALRPCIRCGHVTWFGEKPVNGHDLLPSPSCLLLVNSAIWEYLEQDNHCNYRARSLRTKSQHDEDGKGKE